MNKYGKALNVVKKINLRSEHYVQFEEDNIENVYEEEINILQELVNKETPMKPKIIKNKNRKGTEWVCPNCNHHIAYFDELGIGTVRVFNYCIECGQKLNLRSDIE